MKEYIERPDYQMLPCPYCAKALRFCVWHEYMRCPLCKEGVIIHWLDDSKSKFELRTWPTDWPALESKDAADNPLTSEEEALLADAPVAQDKTRYQAGLEKLLKDANMTETELDELIARVYKDRLRQREGQEAGFDGRTAQDLADNEELSNMALETTT